MYSSSTERIVLSKLARELDDGRGGLTSQAATGRTVSAFGKRRAVGPIDTLTTALASRR